MTDNELKMTKSFQPIQERTLPINEMMKEVYHALQTKGYDPVSQIVGYIMSGDPTYVTSYRDARYLISQVERDEILEEILRAYIANVIEKQ